jgi:hypothetical protein
VLILAGCAFMENKSNPSPTEDTSMRLQTFGAPLPHGYEAWPAQHGFKLHIPKGGVLLVEMFGTALDRETLKVITLVEIVAPDKKERQLRYYTDTEASVKNIYYSPTFFHTLYAAQGESNATWKTFDYNKMIPIVDMSLRKNLNLTDVQIGGFHLLYMSGVFQTMFQVAQILEKEEAVSE